MNASYGLFSPPHPASRFVSAVEAWFRDDSSGMDESMFAALGITAAEWEGFLASGGRQVPAKWRLAEGSGAGVESATG